MLHKTGLFFAVLMVMLLPQLTLAQDTQVDAESPVEWRQVFRSEFFFQNVAVFDANGDPLRAERLTEDPDETERPGIPAYLRVVGDGSVIALEEVTDFNNFAIRSRLRVNSGSIEIAGRRSSCDAHRVMLDPAQSSIMIATTALVNNDLQCVPLDTIFEADDWNVPVGEWVELQLVFRADRIWLTVGDNAVRRSLDPVFTGGIPFSLTLRADGDETPSLDLDNLQIYILEPADGEAVPQADGTGEPLFPEGSG